ncbi:MAG: thiolase family protein [Candidatus Zixiibacteriota bacterium]
MELNDVVCISACRTPMGRFGGTMRNMGSCDIGAVAIAEAVKRSGIDSEQVSEVILGSCRQAGNGPNPSRTAAVRGGIPESVPTQTINMACPSGMKAIQLASQSIRLGDSKVVLVGGFDSMSTIPYLLKNARWAGFKMGDRKLEDGWSDSIDPLIRQGMGVTAENLVDKYKISREVQDAFALSSHQKAARAQQEGWFDSEIVPVEVKSRKETISFSKDETVRPDSSIEKLAKLPAVFRKEGGSVTAGNACSMSDGASALVFTSREHAKSLGAKPLFSLLACSAVAVSPSTMGEGPGVAIPDVLSKAAMTIADPDLIEVNEAFAVQILSNEKVLAWDREIVNVHGGAIALGHPTGNSGARIVVTLYHALKTRNKEIGLASICGGGGVSMALLIKREQ